MALKDELFEVAEQSGIKRSMLGKIIGTEPRRVLRRARRRLNREPKGRKKGFRMVPEHSVIEAMNSENLYWEKGWDLRQDCPKKHIQGTLKTAAKAIAARSICKKRADKGATYNCMRR